MIFKNNNFYTLLSVILIVILSSSCATVNSIPKYSVELNSRVGYCIFVDGVFFGKYIFPQGSHCGGLSSATLENVPIPNEAVITWKKQVHYTKYKDQIPHRVVVSIPKPLPAKKSSERYVFQFTINKDQTVSLKISIR
ncbi:MAG: hypothetical protein ACC657_16910 [Thiohalomonadales bacterium]